MNTRSSSYRIAGIAILAMFFCVSAASISSQTPAATDTTSVPDVKCVIGIVGVKPGTTGVVTVQGDSVRFEAGKKKGEIKIAQITDIYLGNESRQDVSGMGGTALKAAIPYGGGRILSLFSHKVEVMTVTFNDENGAFHGAILVLPEGHATALKSLLVSKGAKVNQHVEPPPPAEEKQ
jgi:hypothetical protein